MDAMIICKRQTGSQILHLRRRPLQKSKVRCRWEFPWKIKKAKNNNKNNSNNNNNNNKLRGITNGKNKSTQFQLELSPTFPSKDWPIWLGKCKAYGHHGPLRSHFLVDKSLRRQVTSAIFSTSSMDKPKPYGTRDSPVT